MTEEKLMIYVLIAGVFMVFGAMLYMWGGYKDKLDRRLMGAFITTIGLNAICILTGKWNISFLLWFPIIFAGRCMGYGENNDIMTTKIIRRSIYAISNILSGVLFCLYFPNGWMVFIPHFGIGLWSVWLGTKNPIHARAEEFFVCILLDLGLFMYPFIV